MSYGNQERCRQKVWNDCGKDFRKTGVKWEQFGSFRWGKETTGIQVTLK